MGLGDTGCFHEIFSKINYFHSFNILWGLPGSSVTCLQNTWTFVCLHDRQRPKEAVRARDFHRLGRQMQARVMSSCPPRRSSPRNDDYTWRGARPWNRHVSPHTGFRGASDAVSGRGWSATRRYQAHGDAFHLFFCICVPLLTEGEADFRDR